MLAFYTATVTTPRTTRRTNTTIITSHMFWPIIIKLTSLLGRILWSGAGRRPGEASPGCEPLPLALR